MKGYKIKLVVGNNTRLLTNFNYEYYRYPSEPEIPKEKQKAIHDYFSGNTWNKPNFCPFKTKRDYIVWHFDLLREYDPDWKYQNPSHESVGGLFKVFFEPTGEDSFFHEWFFQGDFQNGRIEVYHPLHHDGLIPLRIIQFWDAFVVNIEEDFKAFTGDYSDQMLLKLKISSAILKQNGKLIHKRSWHISDPDQTEEPVFVKEEEEEKEEQEKGIITYHTYHDGRIEKHIPKEIDPAYKNKYKYIYHDKKGKEHEICTQEWNQTIEKIKGIRRQPKRNESENEVPTSNSSKIISNEKVQEGQTSRRVIYENGDVAEYGRNQGQNFWRLYPCEPKKKKIEVVRMPDKLNYSQDGILIKYDFYQTKRRYTSPGALAGFIGALAECGFSDIQTTGSCFKEGTCFPSSSHVNGKSIDTKYLAGTELKAGEKKTLNNRQYKLIEALKKFKFNVQITGTSITRKYEETINDPSHDDHLHSGFEEKLVEEKKK